MLICYLYGRKESIMSKLRVKYLGNLLGLKWWIIDVDVCAYAEPCKEIDEISIEKVKIILFRKNFSLKIQCKLFRVNFNGRWWNENNYRLCLKVKKKKIKVSKIFSLHIPKKYLPVLGFLMTNWTLELRLDTALEADVPIETVRPGVGVSTAWTRIRRPDGRRYWRQR